MNASGPAVRAAHVKEELVALERLDAALAARVRARVPLETLATIDEAARVSWLSLAVNLEIVRTVHAEGGDRLTRQWARTSVGIGFGTFLKPLVNVVFALLAQSPTSVYKYAHRAWTGVYRDCGRIEVEEVAPGRTRIAGVEFPLALCAPAFVTAFAGALEACFDLCPYDGAVVIEPSRAGTVQCLATWSPRR